MKGKRVFSIVLFLLSIIPIVFAQTGCCLNPYAQGQYICAENVAAADCGGANFIQEGTCPSSLCEESCFSCTTGSTNVPHWDAPLIGCPQGQTKGAPILGITTREQCLSQTPPTTPTTFNTISGTVYLNNVVVSNALVECIGDFQYTTSGLFSLDTCDQSTTAVTASYQGATGNHPISTTDRQTLATGPLSNVRIDLTSGGTKTVTVNVVDGAGTPLSAEITVKNSQRTDETKTGTSAQFTVTTGSVYVKVVKAGYITYETSGYDMSGTTTTYTIMLSTIANQQLTGWIFDGTNTPPSSTVDNADVNVLSSLGVKIRSVKSSSSGTYAIDVPATDEFKLEVSKTGFNKVTSGDLIFSNLKIPYNVTLPPFAVEAGAHKLTINVKDKTNSAPLPNIHVALSCLKNTNVPPINTGANGVATFVNLESDDVCTAFFDNPYYISDKASNIEILNTDKTMDFSLTLAPKIRVSGTVRDKASYALISGAIITVLDGTTPVIYTTNSQGDFDFYIRKPLVDVSMIVSAVGYKTDSKTIARGAESASYNPLYLESNVCNDKDTLTITLSGAQVGNKIKLSWEADCPPTNYFEITRRIEPGNLETIKSTSPSTSSFTDENIIGNGKYHYQIKANYNFGPLIGDVTKLSNVVDINVGPEICFDGPREFCDENIRKSCGDDFKETTLEQEQQCTSEEICVMPSKYQTTCVKPGECDLCNRPFGVFSSQVSQTYSLFGGKYIIDSSPFFCSSQEIGCYLDYSRTVVDKFKSCLGVENCYDYVSNDACTEHKCTPDACEWMPSSYSELGIGVCRPVDEKEQDCNEFGSLSNNIFAASSGQIAKDLCSLYRNPDNGNECYFSNNKCLNENEVSCRDYDLQTDCVGEDNQEVSVDTTWLIYTNTAKRISGTHELLQRSLDKFDIAVCKYFNGGCFKDADDNEGAGKALIAAKLGSKVKDCDTSSKECNLDSKPPITTIDYKENVRALNFKYTAVDNDTTAPYVSGILATNFKAVHVDENDYISNPTLIYPTIAAQTIGTIPAISLPQEGQYVLFFYSEDIAHNLEKVKNITFNIDKTPPEFDFSKSITPDLDKLTVAFTPTLTLRATTTGERAYCIKEDSTQNVVSGLFTSKLENAITSSFENSLKSDWTEIYSDIGTGENGITATYKFLCYDEAGNTAKCSATSGFTTDSDGKTCVTTFSLDANKIIDNPSRITIGDPPATVKIYTMYDGSCKLLESKYVDPTNCEANYNNVNAIDFTSNGQTSGEFYEHEATINTFEGTETSKTYKVVCSLNDVSGFVCGKEADDIKITIDKLPPTTKVYSIDNEEEEVTFHQPFWLNGPNLILKCVDEQQGGDDGFPSNIGCGTVFHCFGTNCNEFIEPPATQTSKDWVIPLIDSSTTLRYYSKDLLQNTESPVQEKQIKFDNIKPNLIISSPEVTNIVTRDPSITLKGLIENVGPDGCSPGVCDVSPISSAYYEVLDGTNAAPERKQITLVDNDKPEVRMIQSNVVLKQNSKNILYVHAKDEAGNNADVFTVTIIQDSSGPDIENAKLDGKVISTITDTENRPDIEYSHDYELTITNLLDVYAGSSTIPDKKARVVNVSAVDMFGTVYKLVPDQNKNTWTTTIKTSAWPVTSKEFNTFITIVAKDELGNIQQRKINMLISDRTPPTGRFKLENPYGGDVQYLVKGENYVILDASESLKDVSMVFNVTTEDKAAYKVRFVARDFNALTWVGYVNITDTLPNKRAQVQGLLIDLNGLNLSDFTPDESEVKAEDIEVPHPSADEIKNDVYYLTTGTRYAISSGNEYDYLYNLNGEYSETPKLRVGMNNVIVRAENKENHFYKIESQNVFVNTTSNLGASGVDIAEVEQEPDVTNANPLYVVATSAGTPPELYVDNVLKGTLTKLNNEVYYFKQAVDLQETTQPQTISVKRGSDVIETLAVTIDKTITQVSGPIKYESVENITGKYVSNTGTVTINGTYAENNADPDLEVYIIGEDGAKYDATIINRETREFSIENIRLIGRTYAETRNDLKLVFRDKAGNIRERPITIYKDLKPPNLMSLLFTKPFG